MTVTALADVRRRPKPAEAAELARSAGVRLTERRALELLIRLSNGSPIERRRGWLAAELGVTVKTVQRVVGSLERAGLVSVVRRGIGHTSSAYLVNFALLTAESHPADMAVQPGESTESGPDERGQKVPSEGRKCPHSTRGRARRARSSLSLVPPYPRSSERRDDDRQALPHRKRWGPLPREVRARQNSPAGMPALRDRQPHRRARGTTTSSREGAGGCDPEGSATARARGERTPAELARARRRLEEHHHHHHHHHHRRRPDRMRTTYDPSRDHDPLLPVSAVGRCAGAAPAQLDKQAASVKWGSCPGHAPGAGKLTGLVMQGKHLAWRHHTKRTVSGVVIECSASGQRVCDAPARTIATHAGPVCTCHSAQEPATDDVSLFSGQDEQGPENGPQNGAQR